MTLPAIQAAVEWLQRGETRRAISALEELVAREPQAAEAQNALGSALGSAGQIDRAIAAFRAALGLRPSYPAASTNLGSALLECGQVQAARAAFDSAIASGRAPPSAWAGKGMSACWLGRFREARDCFERAVADPRAPPLLHSQRCYVSLLDPELDAAAVAAVHRDYETQLAAPLLAPHSFENGPERQGKLRLGYVSADFREHSVASFLEAVLAAHDRSAVELIAYSDSLREDATTARLRGLCDRFQNVTQLGNDELVRSMRRDQLDVCIDLAGHMQPNRLAAFAQRPAPVLLTYLGYPGTTGMSVFDGRITDACADPVTEPALAGPEPQIHIPGGYFAYTPPCDAPEVCEPPSRASGNITFGSMNDVLKLNDGVLASWAQILARVPGSRLLLKARALSSSDVRERLLRVLGAAQVGAERVALTASTPSRREHLSLYSRIDVGLDTFPYSGATTTCEALYMGVPVVTLAGDRHAGRLSASILSRVGLDQLVTRTLAEYVETAVRTAADLESSRSLRRSLRDRLLSSPLADGARVARAIERVSSALRVKTSTRPRH